MGTRAHTLEECLALKKEYEDYLKEYPENKEHVVITGGNIINQNTSAGSTNPHECHMYKWQVKYKEVTNGGKIEHVKWCLTGDYPFDLRIEDPSGIISGQIWILNEQPWITDIIPKEKIKYDGSNWTHIGRPAGTTFDCNFYVSRVYKYYPATGGTGGSGGKPPTRESGSTTPKPVIYKTPPVLHTLRLIKSHTIDGYILAKLYVSEKENVIQLTKPPGATKVNKMNFNIGTKYYGLEEFDELLKVHPGPWPDCGRDLA